MKPSRPIWGFGWVGWSLLAVAAWLGWVYLSGFDLRHWILAVITDRFGIKSTYWVVLTIVIRQGMTLGLPGFGWWGLMYALVAFHLQRRRSAWVAATVLLVWALLRPQVVYLSLVRPGTGPPGLILGLGASPEIAVLLCFGAADAVLLWVLTRSWAVGAAVAAATVAATLGCGVLGAVGGAAAHASEIAAPYLWHAAVGGALMAWALRARRAMWPEGHCQGCGYDLRGLGGATCPECGAGAAAAGVHSAP